MAASRLFQPSRDLTEVELLEHRKTVTQQRPSLPHQAGKALAKFEAGAPAYLAQLEALRYEPPPKRKRGTPPHLRCESVVKPAPDLSKVVIAMTEYLVAQERKRRDHPSNPDHPRAGHA